MHAIMNGLQHTVSHAIARKPFVWWMFFVLIWYELAYFYEWGDNEHVRGLGEFILLIVLIMVIEQSKQIMCVYFLRQFNYTKKNEETKK